MNNEICTPTIQKVTKGGAIAVVETSERHMRSRDLFGQEDKEGMKDLAEHVQTLSQPRTSCQL